jgi:hypothetical protein
VYSESNETSVTGVQTALGLLGLGTVIGTLTIPANTFQIGDTYALKIGGSITCVNNDVFTLNLLTNLGLATEAVFATVVVTVDGAQTSGWYEIKVEFIVRAVGIAGVAKISTNGHYSYYNSTNVSKGYGFNSINSTTFNTEIDNLLQLSYTTTETTIDYTVSQVSLTKLF